MNTSVSVGIVNFNGAKFIADALKAVQKQTVTVSEIIIVDNASVDNSVEIIKSEFPNAKLILNEENEFFCAGSNQVINETSGEFILLLNNDCILDEGYIENCLKPMLDDEKICAVSGKIR